VTQSWAGATLGEAYGLDKLQVKWRRARVKPKSQIPVSIEEGDFVLLDRVLDHAETEACFSRPSRGWRVALEYQWQIGAGLQPRVAEAPRSPALILPGKQIAAWLGIFSTRRVMITDSLSRIAVCLQRSSRSGGAHEEKRG
jgi:hypothetical protein